VTYLMVVIAAGVVWLVIAERRWRREQDRWIAERDRLDRYGEHLAAANGHPRTGHVHVIPHNGYDHPEPEELV
jgi:hypothetical protein